MDVWPDGGILLKLKAAPLDAYFKNLIQMMPGYLCTPGGGVASSLGKERLIFFNLTMKDFQTGKAS